MTVGRRRRLNSGLLIRRRCAHRRRSSVNFGRQDILSENTCMKKINKVPEFHVIKAPGKNEQNSRNLLDICPKNIFSQLLGARAPCPPFLKPMVVRVDAK